jgi:site-specific DNA-cytosine methylase
MKYIVIQPNLGGIALGVENVTKSKPIAILAFQKLKKVCDLYHNYAVKHGYSGPYLSLSDPDLDKKSEFWPFIDENTKSDFNKLDISNLDLIVSCPKCSGLSMMNQGFKGENRASSDCHLNDYQLLCVQFALSLKPKVFMYENGIGLSEEIGEDLRVKINNIANIEGYSVSYIKVDTRNYGLPHKRPRTMVIFVKSNCPIFENFHEKRVLLKDFLAKYPPEENEDQLQKSFTDKLYVRFAKAKYGSDYFDILCDLLKKHRFARTFDLEDCTLLKSIAKNDKEFKKIDKITERIKVKRGWFEMDDIHIPVDYIGAILFKTFYRDVNIIRHRQISRRDGLRLFGMPEDFQVPKGEYRESCRFIGRNVPVNTVEYFIKQISKYLNNELNLSNKRVNIVDFR